MFCSSAGVGLGRRLESSGEETQTDEVGLALEDPVQGVEEHVDVAAGLALLEDFGEAVEDSEVGGQLGSEGGLEVGVGIGWGFGEHYRERG